MKKLSIYLVVFLLMSINVFAFDSKDKSDLPRETLAEESNSESLSGISDNVDFIDYFRNYISTNSAAVTSEESKESEKGNNASREELQKEGLVDMSASALGVGIF